MPDWNKIIEKATRAELGAVETAVFGAMGAVGLGALRVAVASWKGAEWTYFGKEPLFLKQLLNTSYGDIGKLCGLYALINSANEISAQRLFRKPNGLILTALKFTLSVGGTQWAARKWGLPTNLAVIIISTKVAELFYTILDRDVGVLEQFSFLIQTFNKRLKKIDEKRDWKGLKGFCLHIVNERGMWERARRAANPTYAPGESLNVRLGENRTPGTDAWGEKMRVRYNIEAEDRDAPPVDHRGLPPVVYTAVPAAAPTSLTSPPTNPAPKPAALTEDQQRLAIAYNALTG